jgi:hypothetical protein
MTSNAWGFRRSARFTEASSSSDNPFCTPFVWDGGERQTTSGRPREVTDLVMLVYPDRITGRQEGGRHGERIGTGTRPGVQWADLPTCYEIQSPLGAGEMAEVYRAMDTRPDRTLAI